MTRFYTKEERIAFYTRRIAHAIRRLQALLAEDDFDHTFDEGDKRIQRNLEDRDDAFQDWDSDLQKELNEKLKRSRKKTTAR